MSISSVYDKTKLDFGSVTKNSSFATAATERMSLGFIQSLENIEMEQSDVSSVIGKMRLECSSELNLPGCNQDLTKSTTSDASMFSSTTDCPKKSSTMIEP